MRLLITFFVLCIAFPAFGQIYKYKDPSGRIYFTDKPQRQGYKLIRTFDFSTHRFRKNNGKSLRLLQKEFHPLIERISEKTRIKPELIHAVVQAESAYNPDAVSSAGAMGLMQLMPATAKRYGVPDRRDPEQNLKGGSWYLRDLLVKYGYNLKLALAAYNAGENAVKRYGNKIPPYPETQNYVRKVISFMEKNKSITIP